MCIFRVKSFKVECEHMLRDLNLLTASIFLKTLGFYMEKRYYYFRYDATRKM